jgi:hypothetical protein
MPVRLFYFDLDDLLNTVSLKNYTRSAKKTRFKISSLDYSCAFAQSEILEQILLIFSSYMEIGHKARLRLQ